MLYLFRKNQRPLLWIILTLVIVTFVFLGTAKTGLGPKRNAKTIGMIGEKLITENDLNQATRTSYLSYRLKDVPAERIKLEALEQEAMQNLVILEKAKLAGIIVSDKELQIAIENLFGGKGNFNKDAYLRIIANFTGTRTTEREFEEQLRNVLLLQKVHRFLALSSVVTDDDIKNAYETKNTLIKLAYIPFNYSNYLSKEEIPTNEVEQFFYANQEEFRIPPQVKITYAVVEDNPSAVTFDEGELKEYYEENMELYEITNALAKADSETNEVEFVDEEIQYKPFADVIDEIKETLTVQRANEIAYDKLEQLYFATSGIVSRDIEKRTKAFKDGALKLNIPVVETDLITLEDSIDSITNSYEVVRQAFGMEAGKYSDLIRIPEKGYLIFILKDKTDSYIPELSETEAEVKKEIRRRNALNSARMIATQFKGRIDAKINPSNSFIKVAGTVGLKPQTTLPLDRNSGIESVGCPAEVVSRMFAFPVNSSVVIPYVDGYLLASPIDIYPADPELMYSEIDKLKAMETRKQESAIFYAWLINAFKDVKFNQKTQE